MTTPYKPLQNMPKVPEEHYASFQALKEMFNEGPYSNGQANRLFSGYTYTTETVTVRTDPMEYFAPGYKKCDCGHCIALVEKNIRNANDSSVDWGKDTYPIPLWKQEYKEFCTECRIEFHPAYCYCSRCRSVSYLSYHHTCPMYICNHQTRYKNARGDVSSAVRSGLGLTHDVNPMLPFLSHRMLQLLASSDQLNAGGSSVELIDVLSKHKKKYVVEDIMVLFDGKTLKAFCKKNMKHVKLNKGNKHMASQITVFLTKAQDKAGRRICSDAWSIVLDYLGKSWMENVPAGIKVH